MTRARRAARVPVVLVVVVLQVVVVALAVAPQLSARIAGTQVRLRVAPVDPIDPFRGAYVHLTYPDLPTHDPSASYPEQTEPGTVFVPLERAGEVWTGPASTGVRPVHGPYLTCEDDGWRLRCGIDSWFLPQAEARRVEAALRDGTAVAVVRVDRRGNAALVDVELPN